MKITESILRSIIRSVILENRNSELSPDSIKEIFQGMDFDKLVRDCDLPANDFRSSSHSSNIKARDVIICNGAILKDREYYDAKSEEDYYLVLGFAEGEFEDTSAGSSYTRASVYKRDPSLFDVVYLSDLNGEIYYFVLSEESEINIELVGKIF